MRVVLLERVERLGFIGSVVTVKDGYARNFLIPQKKALRATKENMAYFEARKSSIESDNLKRKEEAELVAVKVNGLAVSIIRQAGDSGHLFGSVRSVDVAEEVGKAGFNIKKEKISMKNPIKTLGVHMVDVSLHPEVSVSVLVNVAQTEEEAEAQLEQFLNPEDDKTQKENKGKENNKVKVEDVLE